MTQTALRQSVCRRRTQLLNLSMKLSDISLVAADGRYAAANAASSVANNRMASFNRVRSKMRW